MWEIIRKRVRYMKKMEQATYIKAGFTAVFAFVSSILGVLAVPVILMVACNIIDYATGLMWLLVIVGAVIDQLIAYAGNVVGYTFPFTFLVACIVAIWIICNEIISILENIKDMGVIIPGFLEPLVRNIKSQVEDKMEIDEDQEDV